MQVRGSFVISVKESGWRDLNPRPLRPERSALPSCATPRLKPRQPIAPAGRLAKPQRKRLCPAARAFEFDQRLGMAGRIEPLGADPLVAEVGVGVAVAAVGEQCDDRSA